MLSDFFLSGNAGSSMQDSITLTAVLMYFFLNQIEIIQYKIISSDFMNDSMQVSLSAFTEICRILDIKHFFFNEK